MFPKDQLINPPQPSWQRWPPAPLVEEPEKEDVLWRYMDLPKFIALLEWDSLHFSQISQLDDPLEGSYPVGDAVAANKKLSDALIDARKLSRNIYYTNCWHLNENESVAMWNLYTSKGNGIAIRTTYDRIIKSIQLDKVTDPIFATKVKYIDYTRDKFKGLIAQSDIFTALMHKHISYAHEAEFRLITTNNIYGTNRKLHTPPGINIPINPNTLIGRPCVTQGTHI